MQNILFGMRMFSKNTFTVQRGCLSEKAPVDVKNPVPLYRDGEAELEFACNFHPFLSFSQL